jgi:release factor glutamine methyltransferase
MPAPDRAQCDVPVLSADAVRQLTTIFREVGLDSPDRDARLLVAGLADLDPAFVVVSPVPLGDDVRLRIADACRRRLDREPVARILGRRGFYGRDFRVTPASLDPRPDTETVVEAALAIATREGWRDRPIRILDVGTGTGIILVTLLAELPLASGLGTDIVPAALEVAAENAARHGVEARASWQLARTFQGIQGTFDLVVSNPPYIPSNAIAELDPEVARFDPATALDGGEDGLSVYRELVAGISDLAPTGWLCLEVGAGQSNDVVKLAARARIEGARRPTIFRDLAGIERCVAIKTQL